MRRLRTGFARIHVLSILAGMTLVAAEPAQSQVQVTVTAEDYARAESLLAQNTSSQVYGASVQPNWLDGDRFWYSNTTQGGVEYVLIDSRQGTRSSAIDPGRLANALGAARDTTFSPNALPFRTFELSDDASTLTLALDESRVECNLSSYTCVEIGRVPDPNSIPSPDGTKAAFISDHNLWVRTVATGEEVQVTVDGVEDFGYATNNAGWVRRDSPVLSWSPGSDMIATFQHDGRGVGEMFMATTNVGHPELQAWKYPLPGDSVIFRIQRVVIHLDGPRVVRLQMPADPHRSTISDHVAGGGGWLDVEWSDDGSQLAFVSTSRDHKEERLRVADPHTGQVRDILEEVEETFFEAGTGRVNWHVLPGSNEVLWYSKRHNWGHLYLYELATGEFKSRVTTGNWNVLQLLRIDEADRTLYFTGVGREPGDPYFEHFYSVRMDGSKLRHLTPDSANHVISLAPSGDYFVDSYSTPVVPPTTVLRDREGNFVMTLETADISHLTATGWQPPTPFVVKARDGETDLHGLLYKPSDFDPQRSYPVINYLYPGPQSGSVGSRTFRASRSDKQSIAELGFIVVEVDAMGTPRRSKAFHDAYYGNMGDNGLPDQITMIQQLGERHSWMDLDHVGIWGHSGGGFASTAGILRYPDFYKVAVSQAGNHDNRNYEDDWGEKWQGLLETYPDGTTNYDNQANQLQAENLKGKLLLAHGTMDTNVPFYNTLLVADALIAADKDFDLIMLPNRSHGFGNEPYMMRRRWDYFVRHLLGVEPPEYTIGAGQRPVT